MAAVIVGAPTPVVLALIVGLFDLIPQIGSTIAAFIVTLITLVATGPFAAAVLLVGAILAVPVAASVKIVVGELTEGRRSRMAGLRESAAGEGPA